MLLQTIVSLGKGEAEINLARLVTIPEEGPTLYVLADAIVSAPIPTKLSLHYDIERGMMGKFFLEAGEESAKFRYPITEVSYAGLRDGFLTGIRQSLEILDGFPTIG